jgi:hypothetical protein
MTTEAGKISGSFEAIKTQTRKHPAAASVVAAVVGIVGAVQGFGSVQDFLDTRYQKREDAAVQAARSDEILRRLERIENKLDGIK